MQIGAAYSLYSTRESSRRPAPVACCSCAVTATSRRKRAALPLLVMYDSGRLVCAAASCLLCATSAVPTAGRSILILACMKFRKSLFGRRLLRGAAVASKLLLLAGMAQRLVRAPHVALASSVILLSGCAQGISLSPATVMSTAVMIGEAVGANTRASGSNGGGSTGSSGARIPRSPAPTAVAARVLETADQYVGVPYRWGGNTPQTGFDCSGFTRYVFAKHGIQLPRTSREQARVGTGIAVDFAAWLPGDLLLFAEPDEAISHVAIYVGDGRIIHASSAIGEVAYLDLSGDRAAWYLENMVAVRRLR